MKQRYIYGTRDENNALTLPAGILTQDLDTMAIRLHDGETLGGFEIAGTRAYEPSTGPGPEELIAGDTTTGFYGEVPTTDFITGDTLASEIGLSAGTAQNNSSPWLKFASDGKTLFVAKKTYRYELTWDDMAAAGIVYGGDDDTTVTIGNRVYRVRLLTGGDGDPASGPGGEWDALIYPVHEDDPNSDGWGVGYDDNDLGIASGDGRTTFCQETDDGATDERVHRGRDAIIFYNTVRSNYVTATVGWRPVLELIGPT